MERHLEKPKIVEITRSVEEAEGIKSIIMPLQLNAKPGQFAMIWLPGVDAKPIAISYQDAESFGVTIAAVGTWSNKICAMKPGELLGVMGPYGNSFKLEGKNIVFVGGGYGAATLMLLAEEAVKRQLNATMIIGAKSKDYIITTLLV